MPLRKVFIRLGVATALLVVFWLVAREWPVAAWIRAAQEAVLATGAWGIVLYPLLFALCNLLLLPGTVIAIGAGLFFGLWKGSALMLAGNMAGAAIAFALGRAMAGRRLEAWLVRYPRWFALRNAIRQEGWKIIFLTQVLPLFPSSLLNYLYGLTTIRFWPCMLWIALGQAPALFLYAYMGTVAQAGLETLEGSATFGDQTMLLAGLGVSLIGFALLTRIALRLMAQTREGNDANRFDTATKRA